MSELAQILSRVDVSSLASFGIHEMALTLGVRFLFHLAFSMSVQLSDGYTVTAKLVIVTMG